MASSLTSIIRKKRVILRLLEGCERGLMVRGSEHENGEPCSNSLSHKRHESIISNSSFGLNSRAYSLAVIDT